MNQVRTEVLIEGFEFDAIIGIHPHERSQAQRVRLDVICEVEPSAAATSDDIGDTLDYHELALALQKLVTEGQFKLLERLSDQCARYVVEQYQQIRSVSVTARKPDAVAEIEAVGVRTTLRLQPD